MAATVTFPDIDPDRNSKRRRTPRILRADFGDGYNQTAGDGLNSYREEWDLSFKDYPDTMVDELTTFLDARNGNEPFFWTPPGETALTPNPKQWKQVGEYERKYTGFRNSTLTFKIERVFNP